MNSGYITSETSHNHALPPVILTKVSKPQKWYSGQPYYYLCKVTIMQTFQIINEKMDGTHLIIK